MSDAKLEDSNFGHPRNEKIKSTVAAILRRRDPESLTAHDNLPQAVHSIVRLDVLVEDLHPRAPRPIYEDASKLESTMLMIRPASSQTELLPQTGKVDSDVSPVAAHVANHQWFSAYVRPGVDELRGNRAQEDLT